jgi:hypothetical protein
MMNWKRLVRKGSGLILILSWYSPGVTEEKNTENLNQDNRSPGMSFEPETFRIEAGVLTFGARRSVCSEEIC